MHLLNNNFSKNNSLIFSSLLFCIINAVISPIAKINIEHGLHHTISTFGGISLIVWFSIGCSLFIIYKNLMPLSLSVKDKMICFIAMLTCILPSSIIAWGSLCCLSLYFSIKFKDKKILSNGFILMAIIALRIPFIQFCLTVFSSSLLNFDAFLVAKFLHLFDASIFSKDNIIYTDMPYSLAIMTGCSSFDNMSLAILLWITLIYLKGDIKSQPAIFYSSVLAISIVMINVFRLSLMAIYEDFYHFFHSNTGLTLLEIIILSTALIFSIVTPIQKDIRC